MTGCNTETLVLTITPSANNTTTISACDTYTWSENGTTYTQSGTYTSVTGCNTETLVLTITPSANNTTTISACDTYTWSENGTTYTQSGTYTSVIGCNTETLVLTITPSTNNTTTISACDTYTRAVNETDLHPERYLHERDRVQHRDLGADHHAEHQYHHHGDRVRATSGAKTDRPTPRAVPTRA
ncbi:MAG: hypothetical protein IPN62_13950 [Flavobacteriales bacterium]|nr:hypothetical protein [Flavobacteriales bacterium]